MIYRFRAAKTFWRSWSKLSKEQQQTARQAFQIFKQNPFDPRLRTHKIHRLSAQYGCTIYAVDIAADCGLPSILKAKLFDQSRSARTTSTRDDAAVWQRRRRDIFVETKPNDV